ncbi:MAG TPA: hypothetical protein VFI62_10180 [Burkholderiales bacterium]|nr:hypothetical protein [Burkholderiales bacterium]
MAHAITSLDAGIPQAAVGPSRGTNRAHRKRSRTLWFRKPRADVSGARHESLPPRTLKRTQAAHHSRTYRAVLCSESRETVKRPGPHKYLRVFDVSLENLEDTPSLARCPLQQRQCPHDLEADLPLIAIGQRADEQPLVRLHPVGVFVGELFEQVHCAH